MNIFDILTDGEIEEFKNCYTKTSLLVRGTQGRFKELISFESLSAILNSTTFPCDDIRIIKDNLYLQYENPDEIIEHIANEATLIFNKIHNRDSKLKELITSISLFLKSPVSANLYLSQAGVGGFGIHYDSHDVMVLQIIGSKQWKIFKPTKQDPLFYMKYHDRIPPVDNPYLELTLNEGDILYIPRGEWHSAIAENETSMHLTIGISNKTGVDFISWLGQELTERPMWRKSFGLSRELQLEELIGELIGILKDKTLSLEYFNFNDLLATQTTHFNLPIQFKYSNQNLKNLIIKKSPGYSRLNEFSDQLILEFKNKKITLHPNAAKLINEIEKGNGINVERSMEELFPFGSSVALNLIHKLIVEGYIIEV
ncbi:MAG: cupin domain-containing protein [Limnohabitans sp.]|nr:cupin domain-containing protein [Limnohabitans sp.]